MKNICVVVSIVALGLLGCAANAEPQTDGSPSLEDAVVRSQAGGGGGGGAAGGAVCDPVFECPSHHHTTCVPNPTPGAACL
jgi:hypothetical protein